MTSISDLPGDLVGEMLSRAPLTSLSAVRSTCKSWNNLSEKQIFGKAARKQFLGFMLMDSRILSMKFDIDGIFVDLSINQVSLFDQVEIFRVYHCDGLVLCAVIRDNMRSVVVWNPYLGQTRWIQPINKFNKFDMYALGYDDNIRRNHKVLRFIDGFDGKDYLHWFEIYSFNSNSWRVLDVNPDWKIMYHQRGVSLKGNTYLVAQENITQDVRIGVFLLCFDFTAERFGPRLPLPLHSFSMCSETVTISCVRDEQLALLYQFREAGLILEFWITTKIEPHAVSWTKFLKVDTSWFFGFPANFFAGSFFIDEEKKVAVVSYLRKYKPTKTCRHQAASYVIGEGGYFKPLNIGHAQKPDKWGYFSELVFCGPYVPSLVQIKINQLGKRKHRDY